jgi:hypothetical protein
MKIGKRGQAFDSGILCQEVRGAHGSIKTSTPAEMLGWEPGLGRKPQDHEPKMFISPRATAAIAMIRLPPARACFVYLTRSGHLVALMIG